MNSTKPSDNQAINSGYRTEFEDGRYDGYQGFQPSAEQWCYQPYRAGYLAGVGEKMRLEQENELLY